MHQIWNTKFPVKTFGSEILTTVMKPSKIPHVAFLIFFHFIFLNYFHFPSSHCANLGSETDKFALLAFKSKVVDDPFGALSTWNDSVDFCQGHGVTCSLRHRRVVALDLRAQNLTGTISPFIANLTFLRLINLHNKINSMVKSHLKLVACFGYDPSDSVLICCKERFLQILLIVQNSGFLT